MSSIFDYDGVLMQTLSKLFDLVVVGILWIIGCIPIITLGASTTAMYSVLMKIVRGESYGVLKAFWKSFKGNFKQATIIWLIFLAIFLVLALDFYLSLWLVNATLKAVLFIFFIFLTVVALCMFLYVFPLQACFYNTIRQTLQNAFFFSLGNMFRTILMVVFDAALIVICIVVPQLSIFMGVIVALVNTLLIRKPFSKYMDANPEEAETEEESEMEETAAIEE